MPSVAADARLLAQAVLAITADAGLTVYDGEAPDGATVPYAVLYEVSGSFTGPMSATSADARRVLQLTSVGDSPEMARAMSDLVAGALLGRSHRDYVIPGRALMGSVEHVASRALARDDDTAGPSLFGHADDFAFRTTPSGG